MTDRTLMSDTLPLGMSRDALLKMARDAGLQKTHPGMAPEVIAFAVMVSLFERERCAKLVDDACAYTGGHGMPGTPSGYDLAKLIRKQPNTTNEPPAVGSITELG